MTRKFGRSSVLAHPTRVWEESTERCESSQAEEASSRRVFAARIPLPILPTPRGLFQHSSHRVALGVDCRWNRADISTLGWKLSHWFVPICLRS